MIILIFVVFEDLSITSLAQIEDFCPPSAYFTLFLIEIVSYYK